MASAPEKIRGGGELFKFRWTAFSRVQQFPFKFYWTHARTFRYFFYTAAIVFPLMVKGTFAVNSPGNKKKWEEIRAAKHHTLFDLPHNH